MLWLQTIFVHSYGGGCLFYVMNSMRCVASHWLCSHTLLVAVLSDIIAKSFCSAEELMMFANIVY